jgi:hypothetical protein
MRARQSVSLQLAAIQKSDSGFVVSRRAASFDSALSADQWKIIGPRLALLQDDIHFLLGDWLNFGRKQMRRWRKCNKGKAERFAFAVASTNVPHGSIGVYAWVCKNLVARYEQLNWSHHVELAAVPRRQQRKMARLAIAGDWTVGQLRAHRRIAAADQIDRGGKAQAAALPLWLFDADRWFGANPPGRWTTAQRAALSPHFKRLEANIRAATG